MTFPWIVVAWFVGAYLLGSVPFGWLIGKAKGVDLRRHGSRNIGATNCGRVCGAPWGVAAFVLDVAKGFLPVLMGVSVVFALQGRHEPKILVWTRIMVIAVGPIVGHTFPVWLKFRGGKAVATSLGVVLALPTLWPLALAAFGLWVLAVLITGYVSVGSSVAALGFGVGYFCFAGEAVWAERLPVTVFVLLLMTVVLVKHRSNYGRLFRGEENRIWGPRKSKVARWSETPALDEDASVVEPRQEEGAPDAEGKKPAR
ncbi:MAG: glycerol-3-phosphate 1-O-acyltransferase PlsY [Phycisphaerae bacterium]